MSTGLPAAAAPVIPIDVSFFPPADGRAGLWRVLHADGTQLFESPIESEARGRLDTLKDMARVRMSAGHQVTGKDMLVLFPPAAPASLLLGALSSEELQREDVLDPVSKTWTMRNVEVFRSGVALKRIDGEWKQLSFTADDVKDLVEAFAALGWTPPVKVTHATEQPIVLEQLPSLARAVALRAAKVKAPDSKVELGAFADLEKVPDALYGAIRSGKLFQRSIEFWRNRIPRPSGGTFPMVLKAVALLGDELPAVRGMAPIDVAPAKFSVEEPFESVTLTLTQEKKPPMDPAKKGEAETVIQLSVADYEKLKQTADTASQEATRLKAEQEASAKRIAKLEADRRIEGATSTTARLTSSGKITPAQQPLVLELLKSLDDDTKDAVTVTLSTKDGEKTAKHTLRGAFVAFLETLSANPAAPKAGVRTAGDHNPGTGVEGGFASLSAADRSAAVAKLGEKYLADAEAAKKPITQLAAYEKARKDLSSGAALLTEEVIRG